MIRENLFKSHSHKGRLRNFSSTNLTTVKCSCQRQANGALGEQSITVTSAPAEEQRKGWCSLHSVLFAQLWAWNLRGDPDNPREVHPGSRQGGERK